MVGHHTILEYSDEDTRVCASDESPHRRQITFEKGRAITMNVHEVRRLRNKTNQERSLPLDIPDIECSFKVCFRAIAVFVLFRASNKHRAWDTLTMFEATVCARL